MLLYLGNEPHAGVRLHVHGSQDSYGNKEPGGRAGRVHSFNNSVLQQEENIHKQRQLLFFVGKTVYWETIT